MISQINHIHEVLEPFTPYLHTHSHFFSLIQSFSTYVTNCETEILNFKPEKSQFSALHIAVKTSLYGWALFDALAPQYSYILLQYLFPLCTSTEIYLETIDLPLNVVSSAFTNPLQHSNVDESISSSNQSDINNNNNNIFPELHNTSIIRTYLSLGIILHQFLMKSLYIYFASQIISPTPSLSETEHIEVANNITNDSNQSSQLSHSYSKTPSIPIENIHKYNLAFYRFIEYLEIHPESSQEPKVSTELFEFLHTILNPLFPSPQFTESTSYASQSATQSGSQDILSKLSTSRSYLLKICSGPFLQQLDSIFVEIFLALRSIGSTFNLHHIDLSTSSIQTLPPAKEQTTEESNEPILVRDFRIQQDKNLQKRMKIIPFEDMSIFHYENALNTMQPQSYLYLNAHSLCLEEFLPLQSIPSLPSSSPAPPPAQSPSKPKTTWKYTPQQLTSAKEYEHYQETLQEDIQIKKLVKASKNHAPPGQIYLPPSISPEIRSITPILPQMPWEQSLLLNISHNIHVICLSMRRLFVSMSEFIIMPITQNDNNNNNNNNSDSDTIQYTIAHFVHYFSAYLCVINPYEIIKKQQLINNDINDETNTNITFSPDIYPLDQFPHLFQQILTHFYLFPSPVQQMLLTTSSYTPVPYDENINIYLSMLSPFQLISNFTCNIFWEEFWGHMFRMLFVAQANKSFDLSNIPQNDINDDTFSFIQNTSLEPQNTPIGRIYTSFLLFIQHFDLRIIDTPNPYVSSLGLILSTISKLLSTKSSSIETLNNDSLQNASLKLSERRFIFWLIETSKRFSLTLPFSKIPIEYELPCYIPKLSQFAPELSYIGCQKLHCNCPVYSQIHHFMIYPSEQNISNQQRENDLVQFYNNFASHLNHTNLTTGGTQHQHNNLTFSTDMYQPGPYLPLFYPINFILSQNHITSAIVPGSSIIASVYKDIMNTKMSLISNLPTFASTTSSEDQKDAEDSNTNTNISTKSPQFSFLFSQFVSPLCSSHHIDVSYTKSSVTTNSVQDQQAKEQKYIDSHPELSHLSLTEQKFFTQQYFNASQRLSSYKQHALYYSTELGQYCYNFYYLLLQFPQPLLVVQLLYNLQRFLFMVKNNKMLTFSHYQEIALRLVVRYFCGDIETIFAAMYPSLESEMLYDKIVQFLNNPIDGYESITMVPILRELNSQIQNDTKQPEKHNNITKEKYQSHDSIFSLHIAPYHNAQELHSIDSLITPFINLCQTSPLIKDLQTVYLNTRWVYLRQQLQHCHIHIDASVRRYIYSNAWRYPASFLNTNLISTALYDKLSLFIYTIYSRTIIFTSWQQVMFPTYRFMQNYQTSKNSKKAALYQWEKDQKEKTKSYQYSLQEQDQIAWTKYLLDTAAAHQKHLQKQQDIERHKALESFRQERENQHNINFQNRQKQLLLQTQSKLQNVLKDVDVNEQLQINDQLTPSENTQTSQSNQNDDNDNDNTKALPLSSMEKQLDASQPSQSSQQSIVSPPAQPSSSSSSSAPICCLIQFPLYLKSDEKQWVAQSVHRLKERAIIQNSQPVFQFSHGNFEVSINQGNLLEEDNIIDENNDDLYVDDDKEPLYNLYDILQQQQQSQSQFDIMNEPDITQNISSSSSSPLSKTEKNLYQYIKQQIHQQSPVLDNLSNLQQFRPIMPPSEDLGELLYSYIYIRLSAVKQLDITTLISQEDLQKTIKSLQPNQFISPLDIFDHSSNYDDEYPDNNDEQKNNKQNNQRFSGINDFYIWEYNIMSLSSSKAILEAMNKFKNDKSRYEKYSDKAFKREMDELFYSTFQLGIIPYYDCKTIVIQQLCSFLSPNTFIGLHQDVPRENHKKPSQDQTGKMSLSQLFNDNEHISYQQHEDKSNQNSNYTGNGDDDDDGIDRDYLHDILMQTQKELYESGAFEHEELEDEVSKLQF